MASGVYAVYPAALTASPSLFLEPWLNLFCLLGAVLLFDGGRIRGPGEPAVGSRHVLGRRCFGFAASIKIWAVVPALVAWALCLLGGAARPGVDSGGPSRGCSLRLPAGSRPGSRCRACRS